MAASALRDSSSDLPIVWEEVACPLCEATDEEPLITATVAAEQLTCHVVRCRACGMAYLNPRPAPPSIGRFYPEAYEPFQAPVPKRTSWWKRVRSRIEGLVRSRYLGDPPSLGHWYENALAFLTAPWLRPSQNSLASLPFHGGGRLLDFGCGSGWYAERMRQRGWQVTGMDLSAHAARRVHQLFGIPVLVGSLPHPEVKPESFDVITMGCVLEHVHQPRQVITAAARALRPNGKLVIVVPNINSWGFRFFGTDWWPLELPRHLLHFTPSTLGRLVAECGLEVQELRMLARAGWMRRSLEIASRRKNASLPCRLLTACRGIRSLPGLLTRWSVSSGQADCILLVANRLDKEKGVAPLHFSLRAA